MYLFVGTGLGIPISLGFLWLFLKRYFSIAGHSEIRLMATSPPGYGVLRWSKRTSLWKALGFNVHPRKRDRTGQWYDARFHKFD